MNPSPMKIQRRVRYRGPAGTVAMSRGATAYFGAHGISAAALRSLTFEGLESHASEAVVVIEVALSATHVPARAFPSRSASQLTPDEVSSLLADRMLELPGGTDLPGWGDLVRLQPPTCVRVRRLVDDGTEPAWLVLVAGGDAARGDAVAMDGDGFFARVRRPSSNDEWRFPGGWDPTLAGALDD